MNEFEGPIDEKLRREFEAAWQHAEPPSIEEYLPPHADSMFLPTLLELVLIDIEMRGKRNSVSGFEGNRIENYLEHFPHLNHDGALPELIEQEFRVRCQLGECPTAEEYIERFPQYVSSSADLPDVLPKRNGDRFLGQTIGPYKVLEKLGEGGFGLVYMAEQQAPVRRMVALKVIKPGMDSSAVIARFEAERQALALMDHENIARVFDGGTTETGQPYFVMELIKGVPITEYCDQNRLTTVQRLQLFQTVCRALHHAHQKGIIHRDIKPSNVLIALYDGKPVPKVIDFGVAKAIEQQLTERTMFTQFGQIIGTPQYMSPEQAELNQLDIDTRSDIYSLGVLLYEQLTGTTPLQLEDLRVAAFDEMLKIIRESEPPKPSTRLGKSGQQLATISAQRSVEPERLGRMVRGELDWIVMKALEKDRSRRYESASAFADDIVAYLKNEPVAACPPTVAYRLQKIVSKNWATLCIAAAFALVLVAGTVISSWQAFEARKQKGQAIHAQHETAQANNALRVALKRAQAETERAEFALQQSERARRRADAVSNFMRNTFQRVDPSQSGVDVRVADILAPAVAEARTSFSDDLIIRAMLLNSLGNAYVSLGSPADAIPQFRDALAILTDHPEADPHELNGVRTNLGAALVYGRSFDEAGPVLQPCLRYYLEANLPYDAADICLMLGHVEASSGNVDEAVRLSQQAFDLITQLPAVSEEAIVTIGERAINVLAQAKSYEQALKLHDELITRLDPDSTEQSTYLGALTIPAIPKVLSETGRTQEAVAHCETRTDMILKATGGTQVDIPRTRWMAAWMSACFDAYYSDRQFTPALGAIGMAYNIDFEILGESHGDTRFTGYKLGIALERTGKYSNAAALYHEYLTRPVGNSNSVGSVEYWNAAYRFVDCCVRCGEVDTAERWIEMTQKKAEDAPDVVVNLHIPRLQSARGMVLVGRKEYPKAESMLLSSLEQLQDLPLEEFPATSDVYERGVQRVIDLYRAWDKPDKVREWEERYEKEFGRADLRYCPPSDSVTEETSE
ncbi:MAG: serine/threonine-protein kinase [Planctomycetaceae bacterium]